MADFCLKTPGKLARNCDFHGEFTVVLPWILVALRGYSQMFHDTLSEFPPYSQQISTILSGFLTIDHSPAARVSTYMCICVYAYSGVFGVRAIAGYLVYMCMFIVEILSGSRC
jgi:hypothetical protein